MADEYWWIKISNRIDIGILFETQPFSELRNLQERHFLRSEITQKPVIHMEVKLE